VATYALAVLVVSGLAASRLKDGRHLDLVTYSDATAPVAGPSAAIGLQAS
jgi:hypothetical protein